MGTSKETDRLSKTTARRFAELQRITWRHPEWWTLGLSALSWLWLLGLHSTPHDHHSAQDMWNSWARETFLWSLMAMAMMLPLIVEPIRFTAARSFWARRHRAIAEFVIGYLTPWVIVGSLLSIPFVYWHSHPGGPASFRLPLAAATFSIAAVWQLTSTRQRVICSCHSARPLSPSGWRADRDCLHFGWTIGTRCLVTCGTLMLACALAGHNAWVMIGATFLAVIERYTVRPDQRLQSGALTALAALYFGKAML